MSFTKHKQMTESAGKDSAVPISELTLGEAESFLNSLMCLPEITDTAQGTRSSIWYSDAEQGIFLTF